MHCVRRFAPPRCVVRGVGPCRRSAATVALLDVSHPGDVASLSSWLSENPAARPRCVLGKTEGNGCVNDFTRGYASHMVDTALGARRDDAAIIMSGGTEGLLTPHLLLFADEPNERQQLGGGSSQRLALGVARSRDLAPHELGRAAQIEATRDAVLAACADAQLDATEVCFAQIKCPLLTPERIAASEAPCATNDGYHSMGLSRGASALGVALATGEIESSLLSAAADGINSDYAAFASAVASASAGVELMHAEVFVLGNRMGSASPLKAAHCVMQDACDAPSVVRMLREAGLEMKDGQLTGEAQRRVRAVLAKADPAPSVRGQRTTMCADSDLHATRHSRACVGGLLGGIFGETRLYVSGGAEHQGPEGGGPVCVVYEAAA